MPPTPASVVEQWQSLPRTVLQEKVRQVVKRRDADAKQIWAHVRANSVLAAQVRGALSALRAEVRGTRDEVMWTMWIDQARAVLDASPDKAAADKPAAETSVTEAPAEKAAAPAKAPAQKSKAASAPAQEKPAAAAKTTETVAAEKRPAPVKPAFTATKPESEPEPAQQLTYTPQADKPRTAPAVAPVMFQAPGT